jgi:hypothetical protein
LITTKFLWFKLHSNLIKKVHLNLCAQDHP